MQFIFISISWKNLNYEKWRGNSMSSSHHAPKNMHGNIFRREFGQSSPWENLFIGLEALRRWQHRASYSNQIIFCSVGRTRRERPKFILIVWRSWLVFQFPFIAFASLLFSFFFRFVFKAKNKKHNKIIIVKWMGMKRVYGQINTFAHSTSVPVPRCCK